MVILCLPSPRSYAAIDHFREVALAWAIAFTGIAVGFWQVAATTGSPGPGILRASLD